MQTKAAPTYPTPINLGANSKYEYKSFTTPPSSDFKFHTQFQSDLDITAMPELDFTGAFKTSLGTANGFYLLGADGVGFLNSGSSKQGDACIVLNTKGRIATTISWTAKTFSQGDGTTVKRTAGIACQYRLNETSPWINVAEPFTSKTLGESRTYTNVMLPYETDNQEKVYVRWLYYAPASLNVGAGGSRPMLGFDDVTVQSQADVGAPTKMSVESILPNTLTKNNQFNLTIKTIDDNNLLKRVTANTVISLSVKHSDGTLTPLTNGVNTLPNNDRLLTFKNVTIADTGKVKLAIQTVSGFMLPTLEYEVYVAPAPDVFYFENVYTKAHVNGVLPKFQVVSKDGNGNYYNNFSGPISLTITNGDNSVITGTLTKYAINGKAEFNDVYFTQPGVYHVEAFSQGVPLSERVIINVKPEPTFTELIVPQYMTGYSTSNIKTDKDYSAAAHNWKIPAYAMIKIDNLHPNTEYRFTTRGIPVTNLGPATEGVGACIYEDKVGNDTYFSSTYAANKLEDDMIGKSVSPYSSFKTNIDGSYTAFVNIVPNTWSFYYDYDNNAADKVNKLNWIINLGTEKGNVFKRYRTTKSTKPLCFSENANKGITGIVDNDSKLSEGHYVVLYGKDGSNEIPLSIARVQNDGVQLIDINNKTGVVFPPSGPAFYVETDLKSRSWATIIPNSLNSSEAAPTSAGIVKIEEYDADGKLIKTWNDADGVWGGVNTNLVKQGKFNPIQFGTPNIGELTFANSSNNKVCADGDLKISCNAHGESTVDVYYSEDNGTTYSKLAGGVQTQPAQNGDNFLNASISLNNFKAFGKPVIIKVASPEHATVYSVSNSIVVYSHATISAIVGGGNYCKGTNVRLEAKASGSITKYQWKKNNAIIEGANDAILLINNADYDASALYSCTLESSSACASTASQSVLVYIQENTKVIDNPNDCNVKKGHIASFSVNEFSSENAKDSNIRYQWYFGAKALNDDAKYAGSKSSTLKISNVTSLDTVSGYWVRISGLCNFAESKPAKIKLIELNIDNITENQTLCAGSKLKLEVVTNYESSDFEYQWYKDGAILSSQKSKELEIDNVSVNNSGNYYLTITSKTDKYEITSPKASVAVNDKPIIVIQPQSAFNVSLTEIVNIRVETSPRTPSKYQWFRNGVKIDEETNSSIEFAVTSEYQTGEYYCVLTNDCGATQSNFSKVVLSPNKLVSSADDKVSDGFILFAARPNPSNSLATIKYYLPKSSHVVLSLRDAFGRTIKTFVNEFKNEGVNEIAIDLNALNLSDGAYYYDLVGDGVNLQNKLIYIK
jgi:hypothetical protein